MFSRIKNYALKHLLFKIKGVGGYFGIKNLFKKFKVSIRIRELAFLLLKQWENILG